MSIASPQERKPYMRMVTRRATGSDFNLFNAIVGSQPIMEPAAAEHAATKTLAAAPPPPPPTLKTRLKKELASLPTPARSAAVIATQVRDLCERGITLHIKRPQMAQWLRQMSGQAFRRLEEAQARLNSARFRSDARRNEQRAA